MRVGAEVVPWINGRSVVFDDSYEHEVTIVAKNVSLRGEEGISPYIVRTKHQP